MQDMHPDTESDSKPEKDLFRFAQQAVQEAAECRTSRIAEVKRALNDQRLMLNADILASRIVADPLHQVHCDM